MWYAFGNIENISTSVKVVTNVDVLSVGGLWRQCAGADVMPPVATKPRNATSNYGSRLCFEIHAKLRNNPKILNLFVC